MMDGLPELVCGCDGGRDHVPLKPVEKAVEIAVGMVQPLTAVEDVAVHKARGRVLARSLRAGRPMPLFDNSAMDGFAVAFSDFAGEGPWHLPVAGTIAAGAAALVLTAGTALRIFTGAPVPAGSDAVVMQEKCDDRGDTVLIHVRPRRGDNIRRAGEDIASGDLLVSAGTMLGGRHVGLLAGNGHGHIPVVRRPRIAVLSTGDELGEEGASIHDANRPMLLALCEGLGAEMTDLGICPDDMDRMTDIFLTSAGRFDLILTSGAASVGGRDFVRPALLAAGGTVEAWRVALKPGKPVFFGRIAGTLVTGLPGNPLSAYVGFQLFVARQIGAMLGLGGPSARPETAVAGVGWERRPGRTEYLPGQVVGRTESGLPIVEPLGHGSSAALMPLSLGDGVIVLAADSMHVARGDVIDWMPFCRKDLSWKIT
ncbi:molybdopterin molybdenumtransferase MoeA [Ciceribacter ferrooxidans]|uniref:Molybdopterin molybdenumtransferase n=2 Tax=Ciceribacter ferrooxidans TaxID=2509717 RepID=A0A4Q2U170_9HYPH|nr:molybdopterin molybdenumtransferase MoeA [Ciceribacter ferrooxidans]